jgi:hypothetical protein
LPATPAAFGVQDRGTGAVEPDQINGLGFMLADKKQGPLKLEVGWVKVRPLDEQDAVAGQNR